LLENLNSLGGSNPQLARHKNIMKTATKKEFFDEFESDILKHLMIWKEQEPIIRKALKKSAEYLLQTPEFKGCKDIGDVDPETALMFMFETYLKIASIIKQEAEIRAKRKLKKYWQVLEKKLDKQKEKIWDLIFSSYPKDMESFDTITKDQAYRLLKTFWNKLERFK